ncbi:MAG: hypothetical protein ACYTFK_14545 [Planctomycetota bacterium]|jgi:hypothetical protein
MEIKIVCEECGQDVPIISSKMSSVGGYPSVVTLKTNHFCPEPVPEFHCTVGEAIAECKGEVVEVAYYKKNGDFRTLIGMFPTNMKQKTGYAWFLERVVGEGQMEPRLLIRRAISSITRESDGAMFIV